MGWFGDQCGNVQASGIDVVFYENECVILGCKHV